MAAGTVFTDSDICCFKTLFALLQLILGMPAAMRVDFLFRTGIFNINSYTVVPLFEVIALCCQLPFDVSAVCLQSSVCLILFKALCLPASFLGSLI